MSKIKSVLILICLLLLFLDIAHAATDDEAAINNPNGISPPKKGNFALPAPQQPGPFISFGQTIIGRNHLQLESTTLGTFPGNNAFENINGAMIFGISDKTSLYFNYPIESNYQHRRHRLTGIEEIILQLEHSFYSNGTANYQEQATIVGLTTIPIKTSDATREVPTGYGAPGFFLGATYNRTTVDWLAFASPGYFLTVPNHNIQAGSQAFYQAGIGRNIWSKTDQFILMGLLEFNGQYTAKNRILGYNDNNTGGNIISLTPSVWLSTQHFILQLGIGFPVVQNLNGDQNKTDYYLATTLNWTIA